MTLSKNAIVALVIVAIVVIAGIAVVGSGFLKENKVGVTYEGNGGIGTDGKTSTVLSNSEAVDGSIIFTYADHTFSNWNTKADGTGTTYRTGDPVSNDIKLFAQWTSKNVYMITNYSVSNISGAIYTLNGELLTMFSTVYSTSMITIGNGSNWSFDGDHTFTGTVKGHQYTIAVSISGCTEGTLLMDVYDGIPTIGFKTTQDIGINISEHFVK